MPCGAGSKTRSEPGKRCDAHRLAVRPGGGTFGTIDEHGNLAGPERCASALPRRTAPCPAAPEP